jgi:hypothetical protein
MLSPAEWPLRAPLAIGTAPESPPGARPSPGRLAPRPGALFVAAIAVIGSPHTTLIFVNECGWRSLKGHRVASGAIASDYGDGPQGNVGVGSAGYSGRGRRSLDSLPALPPSAITSADICRSPLEPSHPAARVSAA